MHLRTLPFVALIACAAGGLPAQQPEPAPASVDAAVQGAFDGWQTAWRAFVEASRRARESGALPKGGVPPEPVQQAEAAARRACAAAIERFGDRTDLSAASFALLARMQETNRDYADAVRLYAASLERGDAERPDLRTLHAICIAAMNSKDDALAARWMATAIAAEDRAGERTDASIRTTYYPRTLIALGDWQALDALLATLRADASAECRTAALTFGAVAAIHRGDVAGARRAVETIRAQPAAYPDHQGWAAMALFALCVHDGDFDAGAKVVRDYLATPAAERSARDRNTRRYLAAVAPFVGRPAPALRADHCVGGELTGADVLPSLRGKVVVLDFWQPWCEPCRKAMPEMVAAQRDHADDVQVLGVCKVETWGYDVSAKQVVRPLAAADYPAHVADFRADMQLTYPLLVCDTDANSTAYGIAGVPTLVVVDREGIVRYMSCGAGEPGLFRLALQGVVAARGAR